MKICLSAFAFLTLLGPALAHETGRGPNGGPVAEAGSYHVELVAKGEAIDAYLTDAGEKAISPAGFKATALLVVDGKPQRIILEPNERRLSGKASIALPTSPKGAVQITAPDGKTASARFN